MRTKAHLRDLLEGADGDILNLGVCSRADSIEGVLEPLEESVRLRASLSLSRTITTGLDAWMLMYTLQGALHA